MSESEHTVGRFLKCDFNFFFRSVLKNVIGTRCILRFYSNFLKETLQCFFLIYCNTQFDKIGILHAKSRMLRNVAVF